LFPRHESPTCRPRPSGPGWSRGENSCRILDFCVYRRASRIVFLSVTPSTRSGAGEAISPHRSGRLLCSVRNDMLLCSGCNDMLQIDHFPRNASWPPPSRGQAHYERGRRVKQSQFVPPDRWRASANKQSQLRRACRPGPGAARTNKANLEQPGWTQGPVVQTNPICRVRQRGGMPL
jgi:hypothetical protein